MVSSEHRDCCLRYADLRNLFTLYIFTAGNCGCGVVLWVGILFHRPFLIIFQPHRKKKPFIEKKKAVSFHLVHRSQRDPLAADETAPQRVLLPTQKVGLAL